MTKTNAQPRPVGTTVLFLLALALAALALPASSLADPPAGGGLPLVVSPPSLSFEKTTVGNQAPSLGVDLYNEGEEDAPIDKIAIEGEDATSFNLNSSGCGAIFQSQHCGLWFTFMPNSPGEKHALRDLRHRGRAAAELLALQLRLRAAAGLRKPQYIPAADQQR